MNSRRSSRKQNGFQNPVHPWDAPERKYIYNDDISRDPCVDAHDAADADSTDAGAHPGFACDAGKSGKEAGRAVHPCDGDQWERLVLCFHIVRSAESGL